MQDKRALKNANNLGSWRAWEQQAQEQSGFYAIAGIFMPVLMLLFVLGYVLFRLDLRDALVGFGLYLAVSLGLMGFAMLRLNAWKRANPWSPPA